MNHDLKVKVLNYMPRSRFDINRLWGDLQGFDWSDHILSSVSRSKLSGAGAKGTALCPFHTEKHPSFSFSSEGVYHCFSCSAQGNIYDFVGQLEGLRGDPLWERLATIAGLNPSDYLSDGPDRGRWHLEQAVLLARPRCNQFFRRSLQPRHLDQAKKPHLLVPSIVEQFEVGYCGRSSGFLTKALQHLEPEVLIEARLITQKDGELVPALYDHLTFPIYGPRGLEGWTARNLSHKPGKPGKWIRLGASTSDLPYGLYTAGGLCPLPGNLRRIVLTEGAMDTIAVRLACPDALSVGCFGINANLNFLIALHRKVGCPEVTICLDPDDAGVRGTKSLIRALIDYRAKFSWPREVSIVPLPIDQDPGSLDREILSNLVHAPIFWADWWISTYPDSEEGVEALRKDLGQWDNPPYEARALQESARALHGKGFASEVDRLLGQGSSKRTARRKPATKHPLLRAWVMPWRDCPPFQRDIIRAEIVRLINLSEESQAAWNEEQWDAAAWGQHPSQEEFQAFFDSYVGELSASKIV